MKKLSKNEFMHKYMNDKYRKRVVEREKADGAERHSIENHYKIQKSISRRRGY